jgi:phosphonate transport system substrate-binding protein
MAHACFPQKNFWSSIGAFLVFLCLCIITLTGCSGTEPPAPRKSAHPKKALLIGLIPERNIFKQLERYEPLARYLSKKTGVKIELKVLTRYGNIAENFLSLNLDGAFLGSFTYTLAHAQLGVEPIARPEYTDGSSTYYGMIFVRKDSGITNAKDMQGKVFAFVDKATTAGHLLPLAYFKENNIHDYRTYLKGFYFAGTHEDVIYDVLNKKADIGAAKNTVYSLISQTDKRINEELVILRRSPDVPQNGLAFRKDLDINVRDSIKSELLTMHNDPEGSSLLEKFGARRFVETTDDDYQAVYKYIHEIGLKLKTYEYLNE